MDVILRKSQNVVNEFQPLTLICDLMVLHPFSMINWISNGNTELSKGRYCSPEIDSTKDYNMSCRTHRQYNLTINNVTRKNHGDIWYCREDHFLESQSNDVEIQVKGTPDDASDDAIVTETKNETITQTDNTVTTKSYMALKGNTALIGTSLYCKASNDILPSFVEVTHPRTQFVTAYEDKIVYFECVTSSGYPASSITWYKLTNESEVITSADASITSEMKDRTI
ncbi:hypothetical protein MAR_032446, partial [Mya arenaria]